MFNIAAASYLSLYPSMLVFPVIHLLTRGTDESIQKQVGLSVRSRDGKTGVSIAKWN
jgi:hypothetical protein